MNRPSILWVDSDAQHAMAARQRIATLYPLWQVVNSPNADTARAPLASHAWDAVVWCLRPTAQDILEISSICADRRVLLCLEAHQKALAARAFRSGLADYVVRGADGLAHMPELLERLSALLQPARQEGADPHNAMAVLQAQRAALQATLASMTQGVFKTAPDGSVVVYNQRLLELLDLPESLLASRPTPADLTRFQSERGDFGDGYRLVDRRGHKYVSGGGVSPAPVTYWRTTRDGRTFEVRTTNLADGGLVRTFADVSDYVRVENELRESEARFRSLSDLSSDWYWEHDAEGRFVQLAGDLSVNGIPLSTVMGHTRWEIGALNMTEADWAAHRAVLRSRQPFRDLELQRQRPDGSMHWISVSGVPVLDTDGTLRGYRGVGRDITERKEAERQIERLAFYDALTGLPTAVGLWTGPNARCARLPGRARRERCCSSTSTTSRT